MPQNMRIPENIIANADDLGYNAAVNSAIRYCFEHGYINSCSLMTNMEGFEEAVTMIRESHTIKNIGIHINLAEGKPLTNLQGNYFDKEGNWDVYKTNQVSNWLGSKGKSAFLNEIEAQITKAQAENITISHLDSHLHLHTLPCFYKLFLAAAKQHKLKLRLAQTSKEGSYLKYYYRKYINSQFKKFGLNYSSRFETIEEYFRKNDSGNTGGIVELMLHPSLDPSGALTDHYDPETLKKWLTYLGINP
jgi:predicted glycoside hydrolase/deacetylase ChbG (UPF0249 family)